MASKENKELTQKLRDIMGTMVRAQSDNGLSSELNTILNAKFVEFIFLYFIEMTTII